MSNNYLIVSQRILSNLELEVNLKMKDGWFPLGGICSCPTEPKEEAVLYMDSNSRISTSYLKKSNIKYIQAMIR